MTNEQLTKFFSPFVAADENLLADIKAYSSELKTWNAKANLTGITDDADIFKNHFLDSFSILPYIKDAGSLIDVGTGGGFPGLAVKLVLKDTKVTVLDSVAKKVVFLSHIIEMFKMTKTEAKWGRAEEFGKDPEYRERYDVATARAVAEMSILAELCLPFVKVGGVFIAQKGRDGSEITDASKVIELLGGKIEKIEKVRLPGDEADRNIAIIRKISETSKKYPRKPGIPEKRPIK